MRAGPGPAASERSPSLSKCFWAQGTGDRLCGSTAEEAAAFYDTHSFWGTVFLDPHATTLLPRQPPLQQAPRQSPPCPCATGRPHVSRLQGSGAFLGLVEGTMTCQSAGRLRGVMGDAGAGPLPGHQVQPCDT